MHSIPAPQVASLLIIHVFLCLFSPQTRLLWCFGKLRCRHSAPRLPHLQLRLEQGTRCTRSVATPVHSHFYYLAGERVLNRVFFCLTDLGATHTALPPSHCTGLPGVWLQWQAGEWVKHVSSISCMMLSFFFFTRNSSSPVSEHPSDRTGTPSSSRPVWWRPWWPTWVWATSESTWCPMTMETPWP